MSTTVTEWVLENSPAMGTARLVLLVVGDIVNPDGFGYARMKLLEHRTRLSRRMLQYNLKKLELSGQLVVLTIPGKHHAFYVPMGEEVITDPDVLELFHNIVRANVTELPDRKREQLADHMDPMYAQMSDKTRHSLNRLAQMYHLRPSEPEIDSPVGTDTPPAKRTKRGKGR